MAIAITHAPEHSEFVAFDEHGEVGKLQYVLSEGVIDLRHTVVQPAAEGRGVGSGLVTAALDHARSAGLRVIPTCTFVPAVIARHPEYADLI